MICPQGYTDSLKGGVAVFDKISTNLAHLEGKEKSQTDNSLKSLIVGQ